LVAHTVVNVGPTFATIRDGAGKEERVASRTVVWAAGVQASPLARELAHEAALELDTAGRISVAPDLTLPPHPEVFVIGDMACVHHAGRETPLPGLAPVAIQEGRYVARVIRSRVAGQPTQPFRYRDKGNLATIGRSSAVCDFNVIEVTGFVAWVFWLFVHLFYLIGFENRLLVFIRWTFSFLTRGRGARLITSVSIAASRRNDVDAVAERPSLDRLTNGADARPVSGHRERSEALGAEVREA
jgi:NADH dehydrogenase